MTKQDIFDKVAETLEETFELKPEQIKPEALLGPDLDLDSIDAVDLIVKIQQFTGTKMSPEAFKQVRTLNDVVETIYRLVQEDRGASK